MSENTQVYDEKTEASANDVWKMMVSDVDQETGLDFEFLEVRDYICEHGASKGLEKLFQYYMKKCEKFDPWTTYLLACSHFTLEELEGTAINRNYRRRLEQKVTKLMKAREKDKSSSFHEFLRKNNVE